MPKSLMMLVNPAAGRSMSDLNLGTAVSTFAVNGYCLEDRGGERGEL